LPKILNSRSPSALRAQVCTRSLPPTEVPHALVSYVTATMPTLIIDTVCGIPAFKIQAGANDTVAHLQIKCAKQARVNALIWKNMKLVNNQEHAKVRLSRGRTFLRATDTVAALALQNNAHLMLHIKNQPLIPNFNGNPLVRVAPLPVYSFGREDYDIWVNICAPNGRMLFRLKLTAEMDAQQAIKAAIKQAKLRGFSEPVGPELKHKGVTLQAGKQIHVYRIGAGDELDLHGLGPAFDPPPAEPYDPYIYTPSSLQRPNSQSFNLHAQLAQHHQSFSKVLQERINASRPGSARFSRSGSLGGSARDAWLPAGGSGTGLP